MESVGVSPLKLQTNIDVDKQHERLLRLAERINNIKALGSSVPETS